MIKSLISSKRADLDSRKTKEADVVFTCSDFKIYREFAFKLLLRDTLLWAIKQNGTKKIGC
jgi:hypothetical protein